MSELIPGSQGKGDFDSHVAAMLRTSVKSMPTSGSVGLCVVLTAAELC